MGRLSAASGLLLALPAAAQQDETKRSSSVPRPWASQLRGADDPLDTLFVKLGRGIPLESEIELDPTKSYTFEVSGEGKRTTVYSLGFA